MKESDYSLYQDGRFLIRSYNQQKPFSNFLPGIAGFYGTPMWVFYVNRGQGVVSFGTRNKDNAMLEFYPANKAYQAVTSFGFRTFIKITRAGKTQFYEPFRESATQAVYSPEQSMEVSSHELSLREIHTVLGLDISVKYFTVPGESLAALAREVVVTNTADAAEIEIIDGLPMVNPFGMNEFFMKNMSRTIEAWMIVDNLETKKAPYYRLKVDATDRPEVVEIKEGNFFFSYLEERGGKNTLLEPIADPSVVFGSVLDFSSPKVFYERTPFKVPATQLLENITPSAFGYTSFKLASKQAKTIHSFCGHAKSVELLNQYVTRARRAGYFEQKRTENKQLVDAVKSRIFTISASPAYDLYCGQTYLDNVLRGGMPVYLGSKEKGLAFYVYSRKHGDLERDYNRFLVEPSYFAQGDGNYRDVNQNRRNDVWFEPRVKDTNIKIFLNLVQLDGFNPLVIKGTRFRFRATKEARNILAQFFGSKNASRVEHFMNQPFSLGEWYRFLENEKLITRPRFESLIEELSGFIKAEERAEHGEGFWVDHWTYNLDLIESYLALFPEDWAKLLFDRKDYTFFDNSHRVNARPEKYFLGDEGVVRQYQSVTNDKEKVLKQAGELSWSRTRFGAGDIYHTNLFVKLLCLFTNKFASLDAEGVGVEMEADKPSWYDALNGLPGLLGSSLPETFELKRLALFLIQSLEDLDLDLSSSVQLPVELHEFVQKLSSLLDKHLREKNQNRNFLFWDAATSVKERFREISKFGISGKEKRMTLKDIKNFLEHARGKMEIGIEKAFNAKERLYPTYFENEAVSYKVSPKKGAPKNRSQVSVKPSRFKQTALPFFLEGPVHALKIEKDPAKRKEILRAVRDSDLYDKKLGMYKVCASLSETSREIGRACVFGAGWLENESIWLHMEYKFLLEILRGGLADEFFDDFKKVLIPFQPAERYGRSLLENSSFIVSSAFIDSSRHGAGFVARLSGSTAEFLHMWLIMNAGKRPFTLGPDKKLSLRFEPCLPAFLFTKEDTERVFTGDKGEFRKIRIPKNSFAFLFLGKTLVVYHNPKRLNTYGKLRASVKKITLRNSRGESIEFKGDSVPSPYAARVRDELIPRIDIELA